MPPRHPTIAGALGHVRKALRIAGLQPHGPSGHESRIRRRVLVACSGGADSTALLALLQLLAGDDGLELTVAHIDHGLRRESADEAAAVARLATNLGLDCACERLSLAPGSGLPARAREARRAALLALARDRRCEAIALGHTATDQAETLLMHAARGCGLEGLAAMRPWDAPWLRPLLDLPRAATRALCRRMELEFVDDPTNDDREQPRIRVREGVLPLLRTGNPQVEQALVSLADQAADAEDALAAWAAREESARRLGPATRWSTADLHALPRAVRTRVVRRICALGGADLGALRATVIADIDRALMARAAALGTSSAALRPHLWDLRPGLRVRLDRDGLALVAAGSGAAIP